MLGNLLRNFWVVIVLVIILILVVKMGSGWCFMGLVVLDLFLVGIVVIGMCNLLSSRVLV